jgi:hypothetical protein
MPHSHMHNVPAFSLRAQAGQCPGSPVFQWGRPGGIITVGNGGSGVIPPCSVSALMSWVSKFLSSMAPIIGMTIRAETTRFDGVCRVL